MKIPSIFLAVGNREEFRALVGSARQRGVRVGWLQFDTGVTANAPLGEGPGAENEEPFAIAVLAGMNQVVATKHLKGRPVLKDLVRSHFLGCAAVLIAPLGESESMDATRGLEQPPVRIAADGEAWKLTEPDGSTRRVTADQWFASLRSPQRRGRFPVRRKVEQ